MKTRLLPYILAGTGLVAALTGCTLKEDISRGETLEVPTLVVTEDKDMHGRYTEIKFYDTEKDKKTVERYQAIIWTDYGTGVHRKPVEDLKREEMSEPQRKRVDGMYQAFLSGKHSDIGKGKIRINLD